MSEATLRAFSAEATHRAIRTGNEHVYGFDLHGKTTLYAKDLAKVIAERDDLLAALEALEARVAAADRLAERSRRIIDGYCFTADGNDTWLEVVAIDLTELETALAAYEATKDQSDG